MSEFVDNDYKTKCSERTLQADNNGFFMDFVNLVKSNAGETWIQEVFGKLKTDNERIRCVYSANETKVIVTKLLANVQEIYRKKDATIAVLRRLEAESAFENGDLNKALLLFSQSVLRSPKTGLCNNFDSGLSLSLALWGRCKVLIALEEYALALSDVQQALKECLPSLFKADAYWKMGVCYKALKEDQKSKVAFDLAEKLLESKERQEDLKRDREMNIQYTEKKNQKILPSLDGPPHKKFPCASKKLSVKSAENLGRFVVANEEIKTGETLVVESPYAACLLPGMSGTHCHHCFNRLRAPVGCPDCSNVAFCRPSCKDAAVSTYHAFECKYLDLLIGSGMSILSHTALRMITQQKLENCLGIHKNQSKERILSMCTNSEKREPGDFLQRTLMAAFLLRCLQKCGYFGTKGDEVYPTDQEFMIGELLLYFLQMLQFNAHEIFEQVTTPDHDLKGSRLSYIGLAVYPTVALFNHDCYPAVTRYFVGKDLVIKALRPLKSGDAVAENYGPIFTRKELKERQRILSSRYWFQCQCNACIQNWPNLDGLENVSNRIRCTSKNCDNHFTLPIQNQTVNCPKCRSNINLEGNSKLLRWCEEQYEQGFEFMTTQQYEKAIQVLCEPIDVFHRISSSPHRTTQMAQESLQLCFSSFGNSSNTLIKKT